jgi:hypothetical protein
MEVKPGGHMDFYWAQSNRFLLAVTGSAATLVGVFTILVIHQQHDQRTTAVPTASVRAGADGLTGPDVVAHLNPATTADPANALAGPAPQPPQLAPAPQVATVPVAPAQVAPAPQIIAPPQPVPHRLLKAKTSPRRRVDPVPAPPPAPPPPQTNPVTSVTPMKPGAPPEIP